MEDDIQLQYQVKKVSPADSGKSTETTGRSFQRPSLVIPHAPSLAHSLQPLSWTLAAVVEANQHSKEASGSPPGCGWVVQSVAQKEMSQGSYSTLL